MLTQARLADQGGVVAVVAVQTASTSSTAAGLLERVRTLLRDNPPRAVPGGDGIAPRTDYHHLTPDGFDTGDLCRVLKHCGIETGLTVEHMPDNVEWLSSSCMRMAVRHDLASHPEVLVLPPDIHVALQQDAAQAGHAFAKLWSGRAKSPYPLAHRCIFKYRRAVLIVNVINSNHWFVAELLLEEKTPRVVIHDSLRPTKKCADAQLPQHYTDIAKQLSVWLPEEYAACSTSTGNRERPPKGMSHYAKPITVQVVVNWTYPRQSNGWECGSRALAGARCLQTSTIPDVKRMAELVRAEKENLFQACMAKIDMR